MSSMRKQHDQHVMKNGSGVEIRIDYCSDHRKKAIAVDDTLLSPLVTIMSEHYYIAVKASLHASDTAVFGLEPVEVTALFERFPGSSKNIINGVLIKGII